MFRSEWQPMQNIIPMNLRMAFFTHFLGVKSLWALCLCGSLFGDQG